MTIAGRVSFNPFTIPGLVLWFKADAGVVLNGTKVSQWTDQSGQGNHVVAVGSLQPPYMSGPVPYLNFDGGTYQLKNTTMPAIPVSFEWFAACQPASNTVGQGKLFEFGLTDFSYAYQTNTTPQVFRTVFDGVGVPYTIGNDYIVDVSIGGADGLTSAWWLNGTALTSGASASVGSGGCTIGNAYSLTSQTWRGRYYEFLCFNSFLSRTARSLVTRYLANKWNNIPVTVP
jgi:hypothetical protein